MKLNVSVSMKKNLFSKELDIFTDKVVYDVAVLTREMTKSLRAFPRLTGKLEQTEVASQVVGSNKEYGLTAGVDYAVRVYKYGEKTMWTNPSTQPQWYHSVYEKHQNEILNNAVNRALKEV